MSQIPTQQQIDDIRADIGDAGDAFTNDEIIRVWGRISGAPNEITQHEASVALLIRQLMVQSAKLVDIKAGDTEEKLSQLMKNLRTLFDLYKPSLDAVLSDNRQVALMPARAKRRNGRTYPDGSCDG